MALEFACGNCDARFRVADELAGRRVKCARCRTILELPLPAPVVQPVVPPRYPTFASPPASDDAGDPHPYGPPLERPLHPAFRHDVFQMKQKLFAINETYRFVVGRDRTVLHAERKRRWLRSLAASLAVVAVTALVVGAFFWLAITGPGGGRFQPNAATVIVLALAAPTALVAAFAVSAAASPKRHVEFFADERHSVLLLEIKEDSLWQFVTRTYTVLDPDEGTIGHLEKNVFTDMFRKRWRVYDVDRTLVALGQETPWIVALLRRYSGPLLDLVPFDLLPMNFAVLRPAKGGGHKAIGSFKRKWRFRDHYDLDLQGDVHQRFDRRLAVALAVMLDTGERR